MVCYQITLFVTKEQENAIIHLFAVRNWPYKKTEYDTQPQQCFSPNSQSQGSSENLSQEQYAEKPEISIASIYAGPNMANTYSLLAKKKLLYNSGSDWNTEHRANTKRLLQTAKKSETNQTAQSEISDTNPSTNPFPSLNTADEKKYPCREGNKTVDEPEPRTDFSSDNNLEAIEVKDHLKSNVETLKKYVEVEVKDTELDSGESQKGVNESSYLTEAIYESPVKPAEKDHNSNNKDLAQKNVYCVYQDQNKATIPQNFTVTSNNLEENVTSLDSICSYSKSSKTKPLNQLELERDSLLNKNSVSIDEDSKQNVTSDIILIGQCIDISNNLNQDKTSETEACENVSNQVLRGIKSSRQLKYTHRKQFKDKSPANKSSAKNSAYIYCSGCEHSFRFRKRYVDHIKYDRCGHVCEFCGKIFLYQKYEAYKLHIKHHKNQKDHKCHICGKHYLERYAMLQHVKRHSCPNSVICEVCGLGFPTVKAVNQHKYNIHNDNRHQFLCSECPKTFMSKPGLLYHFQTTHSKDGNETCDLCNKRFNDIKLLKAHMITHVESFVHKCDICNAAFKRVSGLYQHKRRHKNAFSHFCKFCQKGFYDGRAALEHENLHTGAKPHVCSVCGYSCAVRSNLTKHVKLVHKNVTS